jgi:sigma-E factor negative regulatory protein RseA
MNSQAPQAPQAVQAGNDGALGARQCLSALLDGDPHGDDARSAQRACAYWRDDGQARQDWHAWNLIGDVMRSEELAQPPARDAAFLARLRERLATEPVVLAPVPSAPVAARGRRQAWLLPGAVAAGFVAVAGVLVVARTGPAPTTPTLAAAPAASLAQATAPGAPPTSLPGGAALVHDARLDAYLRAHQTARGGMAAAVPGGGMRNVEVTLSPGAER